jgi:hypothetical protein
LLTGCSVALRQLGRVGHEELYQWIGDGNIMVKASFNRCFSSGCDDNASFKFPIS